MLAAPAVAQQGPDDPIEVLVGAGPGGGYDRLARSIQEVAEEEGIITETFTISYHPGAGGAVAWSMLNRNPGDAGKISIFSPNIVSGEVLGSGGPSFEDLTVLGMLVFEDGCFAVKPDAEIASAEALVDALQSDASQVRFGFAVSAGNQWHVAMAKLADAVGADITKVRSTVFDSGGKAVAALLGGHVDVVASGCAQFAKYHEAGDLKVVAVAAPERMGGVLTDAPTWQELGYDVVWGAWRGILGPKDISDEQIAWWEDKLRAVTASPAWKPVADENYWRTDFRGHEETQAMLESEREEYRKALQTLGLIQ
jgi:putative tricarboxylic transport membrane protein